MNMKPNELLDRLAMAREARGDRPEPPNVGQNLGKPVSDAILKYGLTVRQGDPVAAKFLDELRR